MIKARYRDFFYSDVTAPSGPGPPRYRGFTITLRHITPGRTPLGEWSARCWDLYLTINNTHKRQTSISPAWFEPAIPASERPQTSALVLCHWDRPASSSGQSKTFCEIWTLYVYIIMRIQIDNESITLVVKILTSLRITKELKTNKLYYWYYCRVT
jgi:hypothetical protein